MEQELQQQTPATEQTFAEYKAARAGKPVEAEAKPAETPTAPAPVVSEPDKGESAAAPEAAPENVTQETPQKRDRSAAGRAKELLAAGRVDEALKILQAAAAKGSPRAAEMLEELPEARTRKPEQQPSDQPKTEAEKKALRDFLAEYFQSHPNSTYEDGVEAWYEGPGAERVLSTLEKRLEEKRMKEEATRKQQEREAEYRKRMDAAREKYEDFDEVYQAGIEQAQGIPVNTGFQQAVQESDISGELLYYYSKNIGELRNLSNLPPDQAYRAVLRQELKLALPVEPTVTPGKPVIAPSAAPAPVAPVASGAANGKPKNPAEARSFEEYKRLRS